MHWASACPASNVITTPSYSRQAAAGPLRLMHPVSLFFERFQCILHDAFQRHMSDRSYWIRSSPRWQMHDALFAGKHAVFVPRGAPCCPVLSNGTRHCVPQMQVCAS